MKRIIPAVLLALLGSVLLGVACASPSFAGSTVVDPYYVYFQNNSGYAEDIFDDNGSTSWFVYDYENVFNDGNTDANFYFTGSTLDGVWIRGGSYASESSYYSCTFPTAIRLDITANGNKYQRVVYLTDLYNPSGAYGDWMNGYQYLSFGQRYNSVSFVELTVLSSRYDPNGGERFRISDIAFVARSSSDGQPGGGTSTGWNHNTPRANIATTLNQRMATRSGPSTLYSGLGSYYKAGHALRVLTAAWDSRNNIYWVQVEFTYQSQLRRAYTGLKRVNCTIENVPIESVYCMARVKQETRCYYGPGTNYTMFANPVPAGTYGTVYNVENGFVQFEYHAPSGNFVRVWIDGSYVQAE